MSTHRDEHLELCAGLALGSLGEQDRRIIERHLAEGCPECERALADFSTAVIGLAASSPAAEPSPAIKSRVMEAVAREPQDGPETAPAPARGRVITMTPRPPSWTSWAWAATAAVLAIVTALQWNAAERLRLELGHQREQLADAERQLADEQRWAAVMSAPDARVAELQITPAGVRALRARAVYDPKTRAAVLVFENFAAPAGKAYELWAMRPDGVASLGLIKTDAQGNATLRLDDVGTPESLGGFAVSLEPEGGSPNPRAPSGPVVMAGKFGG